MDEFNVLKGGTIDTMGLADSHKNNFRYDVFKSETFDNEFEGISKLVRQKLNDPNYYNARMSKMADQIRENIEMHETGRKSKAEHIV